MSPRAAGLFERWTQLVTVKVRHKGFTNYPSKSKLLSGMIELKIESDAPLEMVQWLVCKKTQVFQSLTVSHNRDEHVNVDFVVDEY